MRHAQSKGRNGGYNLSGQGRAGRCPLRLFTAPPWGNAACAGKGRRPDAGFPTNLLEGRGGGMSKGAPYRDLVVKSGSAHPGPHGGVTIR